MQSCYTQATSKLTAAVHGAGTDDLQGSQRQPFECECLCAITNSTTSDLISTIICQQALNTNAHHFLLLLLLLLPLPYRLLALSSLMVRPGPSLPPTTRPLLLTTSRRTPASPQSSCCSQSTRRSWQRWAQRSVHLPGVVTA
jgi:hypothetical protein